MEHSDNGMMTKIWGRPGWMFNHTITFGYPINPSDEQKESYRRYFLALGDVLPCKYCRDSYNHLVRYGNTALTDADLMNRDSLIRWFYNIHEAVNKKLGVDYGMTEEKLKNKYESFRAKCTKGQTGCVAPLDYRAFSYSKLYEEDAPIIPLSLARQFIPMAKSYGLDNHTLFLDFAKHLNDDYNLLSKQPIWKDRNKQCSALIKRMKLKGIPSVINNRPTREETALIMYGCSILSADELKKLSKKP